MGNSIISIGKKPVYRGVYNSSVKYYSENMVAMCACLFQCAVPSIVDVPPITVDENGTASFANTSSWNVIIDNLSLYNNISYVEEMAALIGESVRGVKKVELVRSVENIDYYHMIFTDGTYYEYRVANAFGLPADQRQEIINQVLAQIDITDLMTDDNLDTNSSNPVKNSAIANAIADVEGDITALQEAVFPLAVTLSLNPSLAENNGQSRNVTASWTVKRNSVSVTPESLILTVGSSQVSVNKTDTSKVLSLSSTTSVTVQATYAGMTKSASKTVTFVLPMYFGFSASASGITPTSFTKQSLKTSPAGSYSLSNSTTGNYMWLCVPSSMSIGTVKSGGFDIPMEAPVTVSGYKCYRSSAALISGTWDIVIS